MIRFEDVSVVRDGVVALDRVTLEIAAGQFVAIVGASGSGKTTLLRLVNRLVEPSAGRVRLSGRPIAEMDPIGLRRSIGYVIQETGLIPHMTVAENVAIVPRLLRWPAERVVAAVRGALSTVGLGVDGFSARYPASLSGGQRQRVAVARALAGDPELLLMDEPFGALDPASREELQDELLAIAGRLRKTVLFVTHDIHEAAHLANRLIVVHGGRIAQDGAPRDVILQPAGPAVERLLGRRRRELESFVRSKS